jgi:hypothetical protein
LIKLSTPLSFRWTVPLSKEKLFFSCTVGCLLGTKTLADDTHTDGTVTVPIFCWAPGKTGPHDQGHFFANVNGDCEKDRKTDVMGEVQSSQQVFKSPVHSENDPWKEPG